MDYTIRQIAKLAGISTRTLRYYDEIGLLKPAGMTEAGYRLYKQAEVDRLQQILFYRELGIGLERIREILNKTSFDEVRALKQHREQLLEQRQRLDLLIANVEKTLANKEGSMEMTDREKFEGFKRKMIDDNEQTYGQEIREKYGDQAVNTSNAKLQQMSEAEWKDLKTLEQELASRLSEAFQTGDPAGELAQQAAEMHKQWLMHYWTSYSSEAHAGLADLYVADERFTAYYDRDQPGTAAFLREAIHIFTGVQH
ncbi:MerR family transcriptional regulator [Paenibacillus physcomitrellae]|uniref:MerR family transcriptional regulator n=1 Tax=Paenibacillus physcomitrellae TaxID=1619311 RepID=A0ABQ1GJP6_9BACL|nr:MerR family transcriptional regulator [Paenibacillus physcomitrellae]GGA45166.1 MerR family transcriptional regulator [Paenibacillus physcomitrellae]